MSETAKVMARCVMTVIVCVCDARARVKRHASGPPPRGSCGRLCSRRAWRARALDRRCIDCCVRPPFFTLRNRCAQASMQTERQRQRGLPIVRGQRTAHGDNAVSGADTQRFRNAHHD